MSDSESGVSADEVDTDIDIYSDPRVKWFKNRILSYIGLEDNELFYNMVEEGDSKKKFLKFLTAPMRPNEFSLDKRTFYVSKIIVDKLIHEDKEFTEWRILPPPPPPPQPLKKKKGKVKDTPEPAADEKGGKGNKGKGKKAAKAPPPPEKDEMDIETAAGTVSEGDEDTKKELASEAPSEPSAPGDDKYYFPPPPEDLNPLLDGTLEFYTVVRSVPRIIQYPKLVPVWGAFFPHLTHRSRRYIYFVRQTQEGIPLMEKAAITMGKMPEYILTGVMTGRFLMSLGSHLKNSFIPLFEKQFREATVTTNETNESTLSRQVSYAGGHHMMDETASQVNYLRPSDYRRMSNIARGENAERRMKSTRSESEGSIDIPVSKKLDVDKTLSSVFEPGIDGEDKQKSTPQEVISDIKELVGSVEWTIEHIEGDIQLPMPNIPTLTEDHHSRIEIVDPQLTKQLEEAVMMWQGHIDSTIAACLGKTRVGNGPVAEYRYWRERDAEISLLVEQLRQPMVVKILSLLEKANSTYIEGFKHYRERLIEQYNLAGDNLKFLSTLMRFFTVIEDNSPLKQVIEILPELVESIYMMWVLSKGYGTDETMVPLLSRISWALCNKLETVLDCHKLFK